MVARLTLFWITATSVLLAASCFQPKTPEGLACSSERECPSGQSCGPDMICRPTGKTPLPGQDSGPDCEAQACLGSCETWNCLTEACEPDDSRCATEEFCNSLTLECNIAVSCTADELLDEKGDCGDCGDRHCNAVGTGSECRQDASECADNCYLFDAQWACIGDCQSGGCDPNGPPCCDTARQCYPLPGNDHECRTEPL